ncbi:hypothetical protein B0F90DRAFT_1807787 [Multifurca ochricompacta]|uniref:BTB domain-containing protein n=1 Tax=Multifurca ochricompacta TaxID=376703 RepID=A0AAD4QPP3_9AGAM|nr:hypothetical protein B0F90DRAFT_1807787 [Multifurca ochricompacta]
MSEHLQHNSSPVSSSAPSTGRVLSQQLWPWSPHVHRSSQSSLSTHSMSTTRQETWDQRPSSGSSSSNTMYHSTNTTTRRAATIAPVASTSQDDLTRHWSFTAFEWVVQDVRKLRDFVEGRGPHKVAEGSGRGEPDRDEFEILRESPLLGDGKYKLEIEIVTTHLPTLSLYVTCLMLDYANAEYEISASMLAAIKCQDDRLGERVARADWAWDTWQTEWTFRQDNEVWQCVLPSLSSLLENPRIGQTDSFVICIQIHTPMGPFFPQHPSAYYVPRDLLEGLEASLDNSNTGDVQFFCLEKASREYSQVPASPTPPNAANSESRLSSSSSHSLSGSRITARKRVIYAHSDILMRRSEYFSSMLSSAFAETVTNEQRKIYTVIVEEADFVTIYWLLKWVYANWLLFKEEDDPRSAVEGIGAGWSVRWLSTQGTAGDKNDIVDDDIVSAASGDSVHSPVDGRGSGSSQGKSTFQSSQSTSSAMRNAVQRPSSASKAPPSSSLRSTSTSSVVSRRGAVPDSPSINLSVSSPAPSSSRTAQSIPIGSSHYANSPRRPRPLAPAVPSSADPHPHPISTPPPASALSVYQIAHRYEMPGLAALALEHMMTTITPQSCFALLLASVVWDELHSLVEDFVVERWNEVQASEEFERGCAEVAAGECVAFFAASTADSNHRLRWGVDGGKTLMALFRRLRSPVLTT